MADDTNFFQEEEQKAQEELAKIKLGEAEYDPKELESLVEKGKKVDEYQKKYNTDFDKAWSSYGKTTGENKDLKAKLERLEQQVQLQQGSTAQPGALTEEQKAQARQQLQEILGGRVITEKDLDSTLEQREAGRALLNDCKAKESEIDGSDGRPKFVTNDILQYMQETGIRNPLKAYKDKYESELDAWKQSELNNARGSNLPTLTPSSVSKAPKAVQVTKENIGQMIKEQLWGSNQE